MQDSNRELAVKITQRLKLYLQKPNFKVKFSVKNGVVFVGDTVSDKVDKNNHKNQENHKTQNKWIFLPVYEKGRTLPKKKLIILKSNHFYLTIMITDRNVHRKLILGKIAKLEKCIFKNMQKINSF